MKALISQKNHDGIKHLKFDPSNKLVNLGKAPC